MPIPQPIYQSFTREELQEIKARAFELASRSGTFGSGISSTWKRAYIALIDAVDRLDAMTARVTECCCHESEGD